MAIRDILLAYDGLPSADAALGVAMVMSAKYQAHLTAIFAQDAQQLNLGLGQWMSAGLRKSLTEAQGRAFEDLRQRFERRVRDAPFRHRTHWIQSSDAPDKAVIEKATTYDVTVVGQADANDSSPMRLHPDRIALLSGKPVIVVPANHSSEFLTGRAVVAWDGKKAAARALSDSMQILGTQDHITLLTVERGDSATEKPVAEIRRHLERHGVECEWARVRPKSMSIGEAIVGFCSDRRPDLLVMGAYERSKLREDLFGGTTNQVLTKSGTPVFLSH